MGDAVVPEQPPEEQQSRRGRVQIAAVLTPWLIVALVAVALLAFRLRRQLRYARLAYTHRRRLRLALTVLIFLRRVRRRG